MGKLLRATARRGSDTANSLRQRGSAAATANRCRRVLALAR